MKEIHTVKAGDPDYPGRMKDLKDMPRELNYIGVLPTERLPSAAVVGGRKCTAYGRSKAYELGRFLAEHGVQVISGMALGIDSYAHEGALSAGGRTFAVLGCGADVCYPGSNSGIYDAICDRGGIISEFKNETPPLKGNFPRRNRIISALADVVVVIEAGLKSGSLITAGFALDQGRAVYAYPDRTDSPLSEGSNRLIADGAGLVYSPEVILDELAGAFVFYPGTESAEHSPGNTLADTCGGAAGTKEISCTQRKLISVIGYDPCSVEELAGLTGEAVSDLQDALFSMMLDGAVRELPGHLYVKA